MFERLEQVEAKYQELTAALSSPEIMNDSARYQKTAKAHAEISELVEKYREYKDLKKGIADTRAMLADESDAEMKAMAEDELAQLEQRLAVVEEDLKVLLLPKDPNDEKNVILEIRAGTGGDEASLFAIMTAPGLWLQRITTQPPADDQVECAIVALAHAMELEAVRGGELVIA